MAFQMAQLEKGKLAAFHRTVIFLGNKPMKFFLVALKKLWSPKLTIAVFNIAPVWTHYFVTDQMTPQGA